MNESSADTLGGEDAVPHSSSVGRQLRLAREAKGLSLADVAEALKLGKGQVEALENDHWSVLPGVTFIRGFVRNYGRLVGLDPEHLMGMLDSKLDATRPELKLPESTHVDMPETGGRVQPRDYMLAIAGVVLVVVAVLVYFLMPDDVGRLRAGAYSLLESISAALKPAAPVQPQTVPVQPIPPKPSATAPAEQPVLPPGTSVNQVLTPQAVEPPPMLLPAPVPPQVSGVATEQTVQASPLIQDNKTLPNVAKPAVPSAPLHFFFGQPSWTEVRDRRGNVVYSQNAAAGTERAIEGEGPFTLVIGNAKTVKLTYRGKPVDLTPHTRGDVARLTLE